MDLLDTRKVSIGKFIRLNQFNPKTEKIYRIESISEKMVISTGRDWLNISP